MHRNVVRPSALAVPLLLLGWTAFHLELTGSFPEADAVLTEAPSEVWLQFSVVPDMERTSFSMRGPDGRVELGEITQGEAEAATKLHAEIAGLMPAGSYTVSWVGAPVGDHAVRGRFTFSVQAAR